MKATPTRWDLAALCSAELVRQAAGHPQLLSVVPVLAGAIAYGFLRAELGCNATAAALRYTSPYNVIAANKKNVQPVETPPLWFEDGTAHPPRLPSHTELAALLAWWERERTSNARSSTTAALGSGAAAVLPPGQKRAGKRVMRLVEGDRPEGDRPE